MGLCGLTLWPHVATIPETTSRMDVCENCPGRPAEEQSAGAEVGTELRPRVGGVRRANSGAWGRSGADAAFAIWAPWHSRLS